MHMNEMIVIDCGFPVGQTSYRYSRGCKSIVYGGVKTS